MMDAHFQNTFANGGTIPEIAKCCIGQPAQDKGLALMVLQRIQPG